MEVGVTTSSLSEPCKLIRQLDNIYNILVLSKTTAYAVRIQIQASASHDVPPVYLLSLATEGWPG